MPLRENAARIPNIHSSRYDQPIVESSGGANRAVQESACYRGASALLPMIALGVVLASPTEPAQSGQPPLEFLIAVLTDADEKGVLSDSISILLSDWIIEHLIAPNTGETAEQVRERLNGLSDSPGDRAVLVALYEDTDGANWSTSTNWLSDRPLGEWHGVRTDGDERVAGLLLSENQLRGRIPPELGRLANLQELVLHNNQLSGPIPPELGSLSNLQWLSLSENRLTGEIPAEIGGLLELRDLSIWGNRLSGHIPSDLGNLTILRWLDMGSNRLSGPIPPELGRLTDIEGLHLGGNQLTGPIPPELGSLSRLLELSLRGNRLSGEIPPELGDLASLVHLWLPENRLSGPIPPELGRLADLEWLNLRGNQLSGPIPSKLGGLANLTGLWLQNNQLSGPIPVELINLTSLGELFLSRNPLAGCIPGILGDVVHNDLGDLGLPFCTATMKRDREALVALYEATDGANWTDSANWLSDRPLGEWYGVFTDSDERVVILYLSENRLSGQVPSELGNLVDLERLWLNDNRLKGPIPRELGDLGNLGWLFLGGNQLSGCIPGSLVAVVHNDLGDLGLSFCAQ